MSPTKALTASRRFLTLVKEALVADLRFLTILPFGTGAQAAASDLTRAIACFPLAGALIGALLAAAGLLFQALFPEHLSDLLLVICLALLTGGLHLDGLADTFDGLGSGKDPAGMLEIMRDSRIGTMGALALVSGFLLKVAALGAIPAGHKAWALIAMATAGRFSMLMPMFLFPYARTEGKARSFFESITPKAFFTALALTVTAVTIVAGIGGFVSLGSCAAFTYLFARAVNRKIGGITGDVLGAVNELSEIVFLLSLSVFLR